MCWNLPILLCRIQKTVCFFTGSVTDSVGHFEFDLPTGSYMVKFMRLGYVAETIPINVSGDMDLGTVILKTMP